MTANKNLSFAIGAFIFGALLLTFLALLFFSGGRLFAKKQSVIMYFEGSVQGLQIGAPIKLKGVVLGEIADIQINFQSLSKHSGGDEGASQAAVTTVVADLLLKRINSSGLAASEEFLTEAVENGLRAQLNYQSFLTGLLYVELDFHPDTPVQRYGYQTALVEIPTMATEFEQISKKFQNINLEDLVSNLNQMVGRVNALLASGEIERTLVGANNTLSAIEKAANGLDGEVAILRRDLSATLAQADQLIGELNNSAPEIVASLNSSLTRLNNSLATVETAASQMAYTFSEDGQTVNKMGAALDDVRRAARALQTLSETLDQNPDAIWRGRENAED
ncbi:MlaD family protein [Simiduia litorea]|uniref:MCE family protein n=1 Tax=Simiduia litorea TaxID=1435348 RepID=UPI0036F3990B